MGVGALRVSAVFLLIVLKFMISKNDVVYVVSRILIVWSRKLRGVRKMIY